MDSAEAAGYLRVTVRTITEEAKRGRLPGRRVGKGWRFSRRGLERWLASGPEAEDMERYRWKSKTEPRSEPETKDDST
jgi:excisionase family DNA binding protein